MQITVIDKRGEGEGSWDRKQPSPIHHSLKFEKNLKNLKMCSRLPPFFKTRPEVYSCARFSTEWVMKLPNFNQSELSSNPILTRVSYEVPSFSLE